MTLEMRLRVPGSGGLRSRSLLFWNLVTLVLAQGLCD